MKNRILYLLVLFVLSGCSKQDTLRVVTFNVRYDNPADGPNRWEMRMPVIESYLQEEKPYIIGMQEVKHNQLLDLESILTGYGYVGTGRDDGKQGGEYTPIFYRTDKFELLENSQFWLSESPEVIGSVGWDAAITRIVTWAKLKHKQSGKVLFFFNTHFDHRGVEARKMSPELIALRIDSIAGDAPVILTGDFNIRKNHATLGSELYDNLIETLKTQSSLTDVMGLSESPVTTAGSTSTGFRADWDTGETGDAIDYIFVNDHFSVKSYRIDRIVENEVFISDHWPVVTELQF